MDLREFLKETISAIVEATRELQSELEDRGVIINPPLSTLNRDLYEHEGRGHVFRRVEIVEFDVAVTAASETGGGGKAGLRVFSVEASADGRQTRSSEEVSRVKFSVPIVLSPASVELKNKESKKRSNKEAAERMKSASSGEKGGWMAG